MALEDRMYFFSTELQGCAPRACKEFKDWIRQHIQGTLGAYLWERVLLNSTNFALQSGLLIAYLEAAFEHHKINQVGSYPSYQAGLKGALRRDMMRVERAIMEKEQRGRKAPSLFEGKEGGHV